MYRATAQHLVAGVLSGYNATVFAYGPSGTAGRAGQHPEEGRGWRQGTLPTAQRPACELPPPTSAPVGPLLSAAREGR